MRPPIQLNLLAVLCLVAGCQCTPFGVETTRFVCQAPADCLDGFECRDVGAGPECVRAGTGADSGVADAGADGGELDAGEVDAGPAEPPTQLRFGTPAHTVDVGGCSPVITIEAAGADGGVARVAAATPVTLDALPAGVTYFETADCSGASVSSASIAADAWATSVYARATDAGSFALNASAAGLASASQLLIARAPPTSLVFVSTAPAAIRGGTCLTATVEARTGATATTVTSNTPIGLSAAPGEVRFYSDGVCTQAITSTVLAANSASATFFVKPLTGGPNTVSAAAPFGTATQLLNTTPIARSGQCTFPARVPLADGGNIGGTTVNCPLSPPLTDLSRSLLFFQSIAVVGGNELGAAQARCRVSSSTNVACTRRQDLTAGEVNYQVAEVPQGLLVQRASSSSCTTAITLSTPVDMGKAFVLKSVANSTTTFDDEDGPIATLASPTSVVLTPTNCDGFDVQVAEWAGLTVTRGFIDGGMPDGSVALEVTGLAPASSNSAVLLQPNPSFSGGRPLCSTMIRAARPSPSSIALSRTAGEAGCPTTTMDTVAYERIDFGTRASVNEYTATFAPGALTATVTIAPVDTSRTLVFASSQIAGGQGAGETDHDGISLFTQAVAHLVLTDSTTVTLRRAEGTSSALLTFYVAELVP